ncbi:MAG: FAD-binding protein [Dehalococcoidales bacterium]|nr:FAD-binding protein [Dehalococcoidales bacterium]
MNYIVLVKQVPDIKNIPNEAWDWEKGILKRGMLENVCNELDKQAMAFAVRMREQKDGKIIALTMGPIFADEVLRYALSLGADEAVLLTDRKLGGADTAATAYPLGQAIRRIEKEILSGDRNYIVITGMQSVDGDTAQVPAQIAEELGIVQIAYATAFDFNGDKLVVDRITRQGKERVAPDTFPCLLTVTKWTEPLNASFSRTRWAYRQKLYQWSAADVAAQDAHIGLAGSRTTVYRIFSPKEVSKRKCIFENDIAKLVQMIKEAYLKRSQAAQEEVKEPAYKLPPGKTPSHTGEVWVYAEQEGGEVHPAVFELLGKARELAQPFNEKVGAVLVGKDVKGLSHELMVRGADKVYLAEHDLLENFLPVPYTKVVADIIFQYKPQILLFSATPAGRELGPRVAYRAKSGLTADCTALDIVDFQRGKQDFTAVMRQTRPALGGNIMAAIITQNSLVQMSTARPGVMRALEPDNTRNGELIEYHPALTEADLGARIISAERRELTSDIAEAGAIACGGAGCKTRDNFDKYIVPLAESLGRFLGEKAMVGATRPAVEMGFIERTHQVGQTGYTVKPRVYVAVGISGAVQHLTGMQNADIIVAVNKEAKAPIFKAADFGVVGNLEEVVPQLIQALEAAGKVGAKP